MTLAIPDIKPVFAGARTLYGRFATAIRDRLPKGLYARALIIIIAPMVLLQSVVTFVFLERHWETVTRRLSTATVQSVAMLIDVYKSYPQDSDYKTLIKLANDDLGLRVKIVPNDELPQIRSKPFFDLLDRTLSDEIKRQIGKPFWIDTVGTSDFVDIRIKLDTAVMHVLARRSQTYASNSHIFLLWMLGTSLVLLTVAILFLRNQIKPILRLAEAAESLGKGRPTPPDFRPRGAREVRQAAQAFIEMRDRIERHVEQRTTMLAGRQPRSPHRADALQASARHVRGIAGARRHACRRRRDEGHARGLCRLRQGRCRRGHRAHRYRARYCPRCRAKPMAATRSASR